jgi:PAS domain S-box-containing protein
MGQFLANNVFRNARRAGEMNRAKTSNHSLISKLNRDYLALSLIPLVTFFICSIAGSYLAQGHIADLIDVSMRELKDEIETQTVRHGEISIQRRAQEVARQIELIINSHPGITIKELQQNPAITRIALQQVGLNGYTSLYEAGTGIIRIHPNGTLIDRSMAVLSEMLPSAWRIFEASLAGAEVSGYYDWLEEDGRFTHKYMALTPIDTQLDGRTLMVAATAYTDEFLDPVHSTRERAQQIADQYRNYVSNQSMLIGAVMAAILTATFFVVSLLSSRAAKKFVLPIRQLARVAAEFGQNMNAEEQKPFLAVRSDEIGELARSFQRMRSQIADQFKRIKNGYEKLCETQQALSESEAHYRSLVDHVPIGIYRTEPGGRIIDVNPALVRMFGYPDKETLLSLPAWDLYVNPQDREMFKEIAELRRIGRPCEFQMRRHDGRAIWVENEAIVVRDGAGSPLYYEGTLKDITERKLAEAALLESEENFRRLVEYAPVAIFCQGGGCFQYLNSAALRLFGAETPDRLVGQPVLDRIHPDLRAAALERRRILVEENMPVPETEWVYLKMDGTPVTVESKAVPIKFRSENAALVLARDITKRKLAQEALRLSEERFRTAFESASVGMCLVSLDGVFLEVNAALASMIGYAPFELVGQPVTAFTHPEDLALRLRFVNDLAAGKLVNGQQERRFIHCSGSVVWTLICSNLQNDQEGRPMHFISLVQDITEGKEAEENLRLAQFCIENAGVGIFRIADDARIQEVNEHACRSLGYSRQELLGMTMLDIDPAFSREKWAAERSLLAEEQVQIIQAHHRRKDGTGFPVEVTVNYLEKDSNGFSYIFVTDVSSRIEAERDREKLQARLRQAQKMEAIGTLAGGIAHDFNNILSVIIGNANILELSEGMAQDDRSSVKQILSAADRAKQLVMQILTFSRQGEQQRLLVNLRPVVKETVNFLKATLPSSIEVRQRIQTDIGVILADPTQIQQVLMNLCTNSAHAMENNESGALEIRLEKGFLTEEEANFETDIEPGEFVKLTVTDTGTGIDPWVRQRLFEPYFTTKEQGKGTGLGLSVVHGIVKAHGGFIKMYSEPEKGTSFFVFFPVTKEGEQTEAASTDNSLPKGSESLLLVEDEKVVAEMTQHMLERLGYRVTVRTSPIEAREAFASNPSKYDAVITDMTMPQMSGISLAKKLLEIRPELPILLCTGFSDRDNEAKARAAGIREFAFKPLALSIMAKTLRIMFDEADRKDEAKA